MTKTATNPGQGELFSELASPDCVRVEEFAYAPSDIDPPSTTLEDYYTTLAGAVKDIARARSNGTGFPKLPESSKPVRTYSEYLDADPDETQRIVSKTAPMHRMRAHEKLRKQHKKEYEKLIAFAKATGGYTVDSVFEVAFLPPDIQEVEYKYFGDEKLTTKELEQKREQLYRRAKKYSKK